MKRTVFYLLLISLALTAFTSHNNRRAAAGTYGICSASPDYLSLQLNPDGTFRYIDGTIPSKKVLVTGTWEQAGAVISLRNYQSPETIHHKWKLDGEDCLKSRKGLEWRRLCKISDRK